MMRQSMGQDLLDPWTPESYADQDSLVFWNRLFTPVKADAGTQSIPFGPGVDPDQSLRRLMDREPKLAHLQDNQVLFFKFDTVTNR